MDDIGLWLLIIGTVVILFWLSFAFSRNAIQSSKKKKVAFAVLFWILISVVMVLSLFISKDIGWGVLAYAYFGIYVIVPSILGLIFGSVIGFAGNDISESNPTKINIFTLVGITIIAYIAFNFAAMFIPYSQYLNLPITFLAPAIYLKKYKQQSWKNSILYSCISTFIVIIIFFIIFLIIKFLT